MVNTVFPRIEARASISFQQVFTLASKQDWPLIEAGVYYASVGGAMRHTVLGRHGSVSLCRDGQENKMAAAMHVYVQTLIFRQLVLYVAIKRLISALWRCPNSTAAQQCSNVLLK